jgi:hypothetical protein
VLIRIAKGKSPESATSTPAGPTKYPTGPSPGFGSYAQKTRIGTYTRMNGVAEEVIKLRMPVVQIAARLVYQGNDVGSRYQFQAPRHG